MPGVTIHLPSPLRKLVQGQRTVTVEADTVLSALRALNEYDSSMSSRLLDSNGTDIRQFVRVFVNGQDIRTMGGPEVSLSDGSEINIVTAFAGG